MKIWKVLILVIIAISLAIFCYQTDFRAVSNSLMSAGYRVLLVFPLTAIAYFLGTLSWYVYLADVRPQITVFQLFCIRLSGETIGLFNPTSVVGGDLAKIYYLRGIMAIDNRTASNAVLSSRFTMVLSQIMLSTLAACWLLQDTAQLLLPPIIKYATYLFLAAFILMQALLIHWMFTSSSKSTDNQQHDLPPDIPEERVSLPSRTTQWCGIDLSHIKRQIFAALSDAKKALKSDKRAFFRSYFLAMAHWVVGSLEFLLILSIMGVDISILQSILIDMGVIVVKSVGAFVPGQFGIEELGNKLMLTSIGISGTAIWLSVSLLRRFRQLVWSLAGIVAHLFISKRVKRYAISR